MPFAISTFYHLPPILICNSLFHCLKLLFRYLRPLFHYLTCFLLFIFIFPNLCSNFIFIWHFILIIHFHILIFIHFLFFFLFLSHSSLISHLTPLFCHITFLFTIISFHISKCTLSVSILMPMSRLLSSLSLPLFLHLQFPCLSILSLSFAELYHISFLSSLNSSHLFLILIGRPCNLTIFSTNRQSILFLCPHIGELCFYKFLVPLLIFRFLTYFSLFPMNAFPRINLTTWPALYILIGNF